jgi:hypothetical protein
MSRYGVAALVGCLYVAVSVWIVRSQGEAYRDGLRRQRLAAQEAQAPSPRSNDAATTPAATTAPLAATAPARPEPPVRPAATAPGAQPARPAGEGSPPAAPPAASVLATTKPALDRAPAQTIGKIPGPASPPQDLDPFWKQDVWKTSWDLAHLTAQEETRLGRQLNALIVQLNRPLETGPWLARVEEAAEPFLKARARKDIDYTFTILDSDEVNAFSHPGGFIYVTRGLFNLIAEDEDYALEFVIGHEIAHVDLQHALKDLRDAEVAKLEGGTLRKLYMLIIPFAYPDAQEFEADAWAYRRMKARGRTDHECLAFLRKLEGYAQAHGFENGRGKPQLGKDSSLLENHLRAHTAPRKRVKQLKELMGRASGAGR